LDEPSLIWEIVCAIATHGLFLDDGVAATAAILSAIVEASFGIAESLRAVARQQGANLDTKELDWSEAAIGEKYV
jgi:hypothetical protein